MRSISILLALLACSGAAASERPFAAFMSDRILYSKVCQGPFDREDDARRVTQLRYVSLDPSEQKQVEDYAFTVADINARHKVDCEDVAGRMRKFLSDR